MMVQHSSSLSEQLSAAFNSANLVNELENYVYCTAQILFTESRTLASKQVCLLAVCGYCFNFLSVEALKNITLYTSQAESTLFRTEFLAIFINLCASSQKDSAPFRGRCLCLCLIYILFFTGMNCKKE